MQGSGCTLSTFPLAVGLTAVPCPAPLLLQWRLLGHGMCVEGMEQVVALTMRGMEDTACPGQPFGLVARHPRKSSSKCPLSCAHVAALRSARVRRALRNALALCIDLGAAEATSRYVQLWRIAELCVDAEALQQLAAQVSLPFYAGKQLSCLPARHSPMRPPNCQFTAPHAPPVAGGTARQGDGHLHPRLRRRWQPCGGRQVCLCSSWKLLPAAGQNSVAAAAAAGWGPQCSVCMPQPLLPLLLGPLPSVGACTWSCPAQMIFAQQLTPSRQAAAQAAAMQGSCNGGRPSCCKRAPPRCPAMQQQTPLMGKRAQQPARHGWTR
jgi:hypothetical protein